MNLEPYPVVERFGSTGGKKSWATSQTIAQGAMSEARALTVRSDPRTARRQLGHLKLGRALRVPLKKSNDSSQPGFTPPVER
jgi:hypothetical protein